jgi:CubicO group peptidase (beta-lactamase class C family)
MKNHSIKLISAMCFFLIGAVAFSDNDPFPWANPWDVGLDHEYVNKAYSGMAQAIQENSGPGVVALVLKDGKIVARRAIGNEQTHIIYRSAGDGELKYIPYSNRMLEDAVFDMASLTKVIATTTSIMILVEQNKISLDDPVVKYIPTFGARAKDKVTIRNLLTHSSGLPAWFPFYDLFIDRNDVYRSIDEDFALEYPPGKNRVYSDLGFMMLGRIVEVVSGKRLDQFTQENIFTPLEMKDTHYLPNLRERTRVAPTEYDPFRNQVLKGIVHDENCRVMSGVSGHAGLYSTVNDLAIFSQMLINKGELNETRILKESTIDTMLTPQLKSSVISKGSSFLKSYNQYLGWWGMNEKALITGLGGLPSSKAFGHTGFTGTVLFIDPEHKTAAIMLTNAVHPKRADANRTNFRRAFFINISKAIVGPTKVNIEPED